MYKARLKAIEQSEEEEEEAAGLCKPRPRPLGSGCRASVLRVAVQLICVVVTWLFFPLATHSLFLS